ncbi:MAG TPA: cation diffusion facilitator family transporter [Bacillota bacterium]|nr:cation diffusion facilitator family transporter [Bacillota bacterium]
MEFSHHHGHDHAHGANKKALLISFILITSYMIVEGVGGFFTNSLALLADAGHMLSDSISLGVGLLAFIVGEKAATHQKTYGYQRLEILAAIFNGMTLLIISILILIAAYKRFFHPPEVASSGMLFIATIGLVVNIVVAWILMRNGDTKENLNVRAAFLHVLGDLLGSIGAIIAALLIMFFNWGWADPLASVIVAILISMSGWKVTKDSLHVLMEGAPKNIDLNDMLHTIKRVTGVKSIHDLHVWSITSGQHILTCHVVVDGHLTIHDSQHILRTIENELQKKGIGHVTIQLEHQEHPHRESLLCENSHE